MDLDTILTIVIAIILFGVAGGALFAVKKLSELRRKLNTEVSPLLDDLKAKTEGLKPAVAQTGPLMRQVNTAMDALGVEMVKLDQKLKPIVSISNNVIHVLDTATNLIAKAKQTAKASLPKRS